jgi:hypothetical protein
VGNIHYTKRTSQQPTQVSNVGTPRCSLKNRIGEIGLSILRRDMELLHLFCCGPVWPYGNASCVYLVTMGKLIDSFIDLLTRLGRLVQKRRNKHTCCMGMVIFNREKKRLANRCNSLNNGLNTAGELCLHASVGNFEHTLFWS